MVPMVDMGLYGFIDLSIGKFTPKKLFMNAYAEEIYE